MDEDLPWSLKLDEDGSIFFRWHGEGNPFMVNLGPLDPVYDKLVEFMAENEPRE